MLLTLVSAEQPARADGTDDLARAVRVRAEFGLSTDPDYVASLSEDPAASTDALGIPLSPAETADIASRPTGSQLADLRRYGSDHPDLWGGIYIDQRAGGVVDIAFASPGAAASSEVAAFVPQGVHFRTREVRWSELELDNAVNAISAALPKLDRGGISVLAVFKDIPNNRVEVDVPDATADVQQSLVNEFGPIVLAKTAEKPRATSCTRWDCAPPWRGGLGISGNATSYIYFCTAGYVGRKNSNYYLITAGHCFNDAGPYAFDWYNSNPCCSNYVGREYQTSVYDGSTADAMAISISSASKSNWLYKSATNPAATITSATSGNIVGDAVCDSVAGVSGVFCGTVTATGGTIGWFGITWHDQSKTDIQVYPGDSGGTVFQNHSLFGIIAAAQGTDSWFSPYDNINSELGVFPCLGSGC